MDLFTEVLRKTGLLPQMDSSDGAASSSSESASGDSSRYLPLYKATLNGDWETAKSFFDKDKDAATAGVNSYLETPLHVSVMTGNANDFVKKLVDMLPPHALAIRDNSDDTALHNAAQVGNIEAAKILVTKNPDLLYMLGGIERLPVQDAVVNCHKETVNYLLSITKPNVDNNPFHGQLGVRLLNSVINSELLDVALDLVRDYPDLALLQYDKTFRTPLSSMAAKDTLFLSGERFSWWEKWIYHRIGVPLKQNKLDKLTSIGGDIENGISEAPVSNRDFPISSGVSQKLEFLLWKVIKRLVPHVEEIMKKKAVHQQALLLVRRLCQEMLVLPQEEASSKFESSICLAAKYGISEIVEVIMVSYPTATYARDENTACDIFSLAARYRCQNVFNLLYSMSDIKYQFFDNRDNEGNNYMHICGKLAPLDRLNLVRGPALQMQRELQWYNEMQKFVHPSRHVWINKDKKNPKMLFTEEHHQLKIDGERWMKDTANACTISAALIATVMFAAVFTVPGGVDKGIPVFSSKIVFELFVVADAISLFTSISSLLMFLSILTSRYAEEDFLYVLPKRLSIGLLSLFISITFMMIAFTAALYFILPGKRAWFLIPVAAFACLPVTSFVLLQFPLLVEVVYSTYGPGIFGKKTDSIVSRGKKLL